jgi:hypothetical protein
MPSCTCNIGKLLDISVERRHDAEFTSSGTRQLHAVSRALLCEANADYCSGFPGLTFFLSGEPKALHLESAARSRLKATSIRQTACESSRNNHDYRREDKGD